MATFDIPLTHSYIISLRKSSSSALESPALLSPTPYPTPVAPFSSSSATSLNPIVSSGNSFNLAVYAR